MSAILQFRDTDNVTVITSFNVGTIASPGSSANKKVYLGNIGDQSATLVTVAIAQIGTNDGYTYAQIALDVAGVPGTFAATTLSLGTIAAAGSTPFWFREVQGAGVTPDANPRSYNLHYAAKTV